jgi:hypothetical protein
MLNGYETYGEITKEGTFLAYNIDELNQYLSNHRGERVVFKIVPRGTQASSRMQGYYKNVIVPAFQKGYFEKGNFYTCKQVDEMIRNMSPLCIEETWDENSKQWNQELKEVHELSNFNLSYFISQLKIIAAEEFSIFIADPKTL